MWIDAPTIRTENDFIPLIRPKPGKSAVVVLNGPPLRLFCHYFRRRTWPCVGAGCPLCDRRASKRLYSYYPVLSLRGNPAVLELTPVSDQSLARQIAEYSDEPVGVVKVTRPTGRNNLPCEVSWREKRDTDPKPNGEIERTFLVRTLCRLWKLPCPDGDPGSADWVLELRQSLIFALDEMESNA